MLDEENATIDPDRVKLFIQTSKYLFHPTGSRFFGGATEESDYDYFAQDSEELRARLEALGLDDLRGHYSITDPEAIQSNPDWDISAVYRYKTDDIQIDIQLVVDYTRRKAVVKGMKLLNILPSIPKDKRSTAWNAMYNVYTDGYLRGKKEPEKKKRWFHRKHD